jgi:RHS repeat-associated protein
VRASSGGNQTVTNTTAYTYFLTTNFAGKECGDCSQGMYWGNENENDYLDYYNAKYMGFAETDVSDSDGSLTKHLFYATEGWGVYDNTQIVNCLPNMQPPGPTPCPNVPWWHLTNAAHGHEYETDFYDTNGTTLLQKSTTQFQALCPPSGVSGTGSVTGYGNFNGNLVSELDLSNPVAVCVVRPTRTDSYTYDGSTAAGVPDMATVPSYDTYGRVTSASTISNNGGATGSPTSLVTTTSYVWDDAVTTSQSSATGTYLIDFPSFSDTEDSSGNRYSCHYTSYDGQANATGQQSGLTLGEVTSSDTYTNCGTAPSWTPSGLIRTTQTYDTYGNQLTTIDPDANAGISGHVGCTVGTTQYSACDAYDSTFDTLPISSKNALNQTSTTGYTDQTASGGFGLWPVATTDFNNQTTSFTYDALGRMASQTLPGEGAGLTTASWSYTFWCTPTGAQTPCIELDETKRLNSTTTITKRAFYDGYGQLVETRTPGPAGQDVVAYATYDASGHMLFESNSYLVPAYTGNPGLAAFANPDSTQKGTSTTYDGLERVKSATDPVGNLTTTTYTVVCGPAGTGDTACYEQAMVTDALNHQSATLADALGRETYAQRYTGNSGGTYALYVTTKYTYDFNGNLTKILHPDGTTTTTFTFDAASRKTGMTDPDRGNETYTYDANGNLTQSVDARGSAGTVYAGYDGLDRMLWRNSSNSPTGAYDTFTYDSTAGGNVGAGRLTSATFVGGPNNTLSGSYAYTYDQRGQQISATTTVGSTSYPVQKTYDDAGNVLTQTYPTGEVATNAYSAQGWLSQVTSTISGSTTTLLSGATYSGAGTDANLLTGAGLLTGASLGNGTYTYAATYDLNHRLTSASLTRFSDTALLFQSHPNYDAVSNVVGVATTLPAGTDQQAFCYDEQNRLTWGSSASGTIPCGGTNTAGTLAGASYTQSFSYDTMGRLTNGPLGSYTYGSSAHIHAATAIGGQWTASYDAAGDMTCRAPTSATTCAGTPTGAQLSYNLEGYPVSWQNAPSSPSTTDSYLYDGQGNRVEQQVTTGLPSNPVTTTTVYIGNVEEITTTGSSTTTTTYYYAGPLRIALAVNGVFSYLGNDTLGSATVALNASGGVQAATLYAPYGSSRYSSGTMPGSYGFTGQHADATTGLDYYVSRYYDPLAGQFTSADTTLPGGGYDAWGLSRYAYVAGNPETHIDADGHCFPVCTMLVGALIGAAAGAVISVSTQVASGKSVNWGEVGKQAAIGAVTGAISGLAGPEAGMVVRGAVDTAASVGGQVISNAIEGKPLGDGVGQAAATGALMSVGLGAAGGLLAKGAGRFFGAIAKDAEGEVAEGLEQAGAKVESDLGGACSTLSFSPDTLVATPSGETPIASVKAGDAVTAYDPATGKSSTQTVEATSIHHDDNLVDITLRTDDAPSTPADGQPKRRAPQSKLRVARRHPPTRWCIPLLTIPG